MGPGLDKAAPAANAGGAGAPEDTDRLERLAGMILEALEEADPTCLIVRRVENGRSVIDGRFNMVTAAKVLSALMQRL